MDKKETIVFLAKEFKKNNLNFNIVQKNGIDIFIIKNKESFKYKIIITDEESDIFDILSQIEDYEYIFDIEKDETLKFYKDIVLFSPKGFEQITKNLLENFVQLQDISKLEDFIKEIK